MTFRLACLTSLGCRLLSDFAFVFYVNAALLLLHLVNLVFSDLIIFFSHPLPLSSPDIQLDVL